METTKKILSGAMWLARGTATMLGLALMLAVVLGVATTANAAVGDPLKLGEINAINKITQLVGKTDGAMLRVDNNSTVSNATALDLQVEPGKAPMKVSSGAGKAVNLNADRLDGRDGATFARSDTPTYVTTNGAATGAPPFGPSASTGASCDDGDRLLTGGYFDLSDNGVAVASFGLEDTWRATVRRTDNSNATISIRATCLDFPPLRP